GQGAGHGRTSSLPRSCANRGGSGGRFQAGVCQPGFSLFTSGQCTGCLHFSTGGGGGRSLSLIGGRPHFKQLVRTQNSGVPLLPATPAHAIRKSLRVLR